MGKRNKVLPFIQHNAPTGSFKRPNHPDFMTTEEHKKNKTTGIRDNKIGLQYEFWILGELKKVVSYQEIARDKDALRKAHVEIFAMQPDTGIK